MPDYTIIRRLGLARNKPDPVASCLQCVSGWFRSV